MIMASCDYMLRPLIRELRERGIPYANPYRAGEKAWNPLRFGVTGLGKKQPEITALDKLLSFLSGSKELRGEQTRDWNWEDIERWTAPLRSKGDNAVLVHGAKAQISRMAKDIPGPKAINIDIFQSLFVGEGWKGHANNAIRADLDWWFDSMRKREMNSFLYFKNIIDNFGQRALVERPKIWVGTIHSFKGGEADNVFVFPDLSPAAHDSLEAGEEDPIGRLFYVAFTRAKQNLILCDADSSRSVEFIPATRGFTRELLTSEDYEVPF